MLASPAPESSRAIVAARMALTLCAVGMFATGLDSYALAAWDAPPPSRWVLAFAGAAAFLVTVEPKRPLGILRSPLGAWTVFYFALTTLWAVFMRSEPEVVQEVYDRYRSIAALVAFAIVFDDPRARRLAILAVAVAVVVTSILNVAEAFSIITFADLPSLERSPGRAAAFFVNPNTSGIAIALGTATVAERIPRVFRVPLMLVATLGVAATYSRGAAICLVVVFLWLAWRRALSTYWIVITLCCGLGALVYASGYLQGHDLLNDNTVARLQLSKDDSGRIYLVRKAWELFMRSPLVGNGLASTVVWDIPLRAHNMFVTLAADHGILGLLAFPALALALVVANPTGIGPALVLMAAGFFSHTLLDDRFALLLIPLAAAGDMLPSRDRGPAAGDEEDVEGGFVSLAGGEDARG